MGHAQDMGFCAQIQLANPTHVQQHMRAHTHTLKNNWCAQE